MLDPKILDGYETISLEEMEKVKLMNRIDTKYVTHISKIKELLQLAKTKYKLQQIEDRCNMPYQTCYYDTPEADMYYQHQRGKKTRQKIRRRLYEENNTPPFLEIKSKNNRGRTKKKRVLMEKGEELHSYSEFFESQTNYDYEELNLKLENHFYRITLVNYDLSERVTIDTSLQFHNFETNEKISLPEIGIIEWKRDGKVSKSGLKDLLRQLRIKESGFSKYVIGMALTDLDLRQNRMKKRLRYIDKISREESH